MIACQGAGGRRLLAQIGTVLDPPAHRYAGQDTATVRPALSHAWREAFGTELSEPSLSRCVAAIATDHPWQLALWSND
ncbi:MAG TPA: hypothetical protein VGH99_17980 [Pseudonocardia sp.]|jgi:hypothetical protein